MKEFDFYGIENGMVKLRFKEYIRNINLWGDYKGVWKCKDKNGFVVENGFSIPTSSIKKFLYDAQSFGKEGYKLSEHDACILNLQLNQPKELIYYGIKNDMVLVKFPSFIKDFKVSEYNAKWGKHDTKNETIIFVPLKAINRFISDLKSKWNYIPPDEMLSDISKLSIGNNGIYKSTNQNKLYKLSVTGMVNQYGFDVVHLNYSTPEMIKELWELKWKALSYVKCNSDKSIDISTNSNMIPTLIEYMKIHSDIDIYELEHFREFKNKSNERLKNIKDSDLPFELYPFQIEDANKIVSRKRCLIGHDMGCGKTLIAIIVGESISNEKKLVVCPATLRLNWQIEILKFRNNADVHIVYSKDKKVDLSHQWTIMGYDTARKYSSDVLRSDINCMFIDEAHNCKAVSCSGNPDSKIAKSIIDISHKVKFCYPITGTPMPTRPQDLFNMFRILKEYESEKDFYNFKQYFCDEIQLGRSNNRIKELHKLLGLYMVRRSKKEALPDLKKRRLFIPIERIFMSKEALKNQQLLYDSGGENFLGLAMTGRKLLSQCKIKQAIELAKSHIDVGESVVIVSEFNDTLDMLQNQFNSIACSIRGGMTDKAKQKAVDDFQSGNKKVCILSLQAGGVGITLTKSHTMIICDYDWTPANMIQVEDRICRTGQSDLCNIEYLYFPNSILDNTFMEMISDKSDVIDRVVDNSKGGVNLKAECKANTTFIEVLKEKIKSKAESNNNQLNVSN